MVTINKHFRHANNDLIRNAYPIFYLSDPRSHLIWIARSLHPFFVFQKLSIILFYKHKLIRIIYNKLLFIYLKCPINMLLDNKTLFKTIILSSIKFFNFMFFISILLKIKKRFLSFRNDLLYRLSRIFLIMRAQFGKRFS